MLPSIPVYLNAARNNYPLDATHSVFGGLAGSATRYSRRWGQQLGLHQGLEVNTRAADELHLRPVLVAINQLFDRYEETVQHTGRPILCWRYSQQPNLSFHRPFRLGGSSKYEVQVSSRLEQSDRNFHSTVSCIRSGLAQPPDRAHLTIKRLLNSPMADHRLAY